MNEIQKKYLSWLGGESRNEVVVEVKRTDDSVTVSRMEGKKDIRPLNDFYFCHGLCF